VNVTPDKREIFLTHEALLLTKLKEKLQSMWGVHDQERTFQVGREGGREGGW
jgi:DNA mismatch repair ATPase MutL